jgi:AGZA family xanthine/uracil permease-like MFS transporter
VGLIPAIVALMFTDLFDSLSTFVGVARAANMLDKDGHPINLREALIVDSFATLVASLFGSSSGTTYVESAAGVEVGGRTGLTSIVTALCFLPCLFVAPIAGMVPACATAPVLIVVGAMMFRTVTELRGDCLEELLPAYATIALIPMTFSITQGILWGFICHTSMYVLVGKWRQVTPTMYVLTALAIGLLVMEQAT